MRRVRKITSQVAGEMFDPDPNYVSIVGTPANQTPWLVVRSEDGTATEVENAEGTNQMNRRTTQRKVRSTPPNVAHVAAIKFDGATFKTSKNVTRYMVNHGYEGFTIEGSAEEGFVVKGTAGIDDAEEIAGQVPGVTYLVAKGADPDEGSDPGATAVNDDAVDDGTAATTENEEGTNATKAEADTTEPDTDAATTEGETGASDDNGDTAADDQPEGPGTVAKEEEADRVEAVKFVATRSHLTRAVAESDDMSTALDVMETAVQKYDYWMADQSKGQTIAAVMQSGDDGLPPAIYELNDAFYTALRNLMVAGNFEGVRALCTEFGDMIIRLHQVFMGGENVTRADMEAAIQAGDARWIAETFEAPATKTDTTDPAAVDAAAKSEDSDATDEDTAKGDAAKAADPDATTGAATADSDGGTKSTKAETDLGTQIGTAIAAAMTPVMEVMKSMTETVGTKAEEAAQAAKSATDRVAAVEAVAQPRQGAEDEGSGPATKSEEDDATKKFEARRQSAIIGRPVRIN